MCWVIVHLVELISEFYFYELASHLKKQTNETEILW